MIKAGLRGPPVHLTRQPFRFFRGGAGNVHISLRSATPRYQQLSFGASHRGEVWGAMRHLGPRSPTWRRSCVRLKPSAKVSGDVTNTNCETRVPTLARRRFFSFSRALSAHTNDYFCRKNCSWRAVPNLAGSSHPFLGVGVNIRVQFFCGEICACEWIFRHLIGSQRRSFFLEFQKHT